MNDKSRFDILTDNELEQVTGGMSCDKALVAAQTYVGIGDFYTSLGMSAAAAGSYGQASGVMQGAC
jgi:bacteriocin-like protein